MIVLLRRSLAVMLATFVLISVSNVDAAYLPANVNTLSGTGEFSLKNGEAKDAKYRFPAYSIQAEDGSIYISDSKNHRIRVITPEGQVEAYAGITEEVDQYGIPLGGLKDGKKEEAMFLDPKGLALDTNGNLFIVDSGNNAIRKVTKEGMVETVVSDLYAPTDIVIAENGDLYVSDTLNHRIVKVKNGNVEVVAGSDYNEEDGWLIGDYRDGRLDVAQFNEPTGLAMDKSGNLYVADSGNQRIRLVNFLANEVETVAGSEDTNIVDTSYIQGNYVDGTALKAKFNFPKGIDVDSAGNIYVADTYNHVIRKISSDGKVQTLAGNGESGLVNGTETEASFSGPTDIELLTNGNLLVVDQLNNKLRTIELFQIPKKPTNDIGIFFDGKYIEFDDVKPRIVNDRTMVPLRFLSESLGYTVYWNGDTRVIVLKKDDRHIRLQIGNPEVVGDVEMTLDSVPYIENDRTLVPIRFVVEAFDYNVTWLNEERTVLIRE